MLRKFNTLVRLLIVGLLIYPFPVAFAVEQTVNEGFEDSTYESGFTISATSDPVQIYSAEIDNYGTTGASLGVCHMNNGCTAEYTFEFSSDIDVYYVSFIVGAANQAFSVTWHYSDDSTDVVNFAAQSNSNLSTMYDTVTKTLVDYNADENNTDIYVTKFVLDINDWSLFDTLVFKYDDGLTTGIGDPTNLTTSANLHAGEIIVDWDAPTGYSNTPERYAVAFSDDNFVSTNFAVATTTNSGDTAYTFTKSYLQSTFTDLTHGDTLYFKIRSDDDTNSLYSNWTSVVSYTIEEVASGVTNLSVSQADYQGVTFTLTQPNTGWATQTTYKLAYRDQESNDWYYKDNIDASATTYLFDDVTAGDFVFNLYACTQNGSWCHGTQGGEVLYTVSNSTPTTTIATLGPPMNPVVTQEYNVGVKVDWDEANTGNLTADSYELYYRTSADNEIKITGITETEYTIPYGNIPNGTWTFSIRGFNSNNSLYSGYSTEPSLEVFNQKQYEIDEEDRKRREYEAELQRQRDKNLSETGYSETDSERSNREYEEEQARLRELQRQRDKNAAETGYAETDQERSDREAREYQEMLDRNFADTGYYETDQERADREYREEQERLQAEREKNFAETGYMELDSERADREQKEEEERIAKEVAESLKITSDPEDPEGTAVDPEEQKKIDELVDTIIELKETLDLEVYEVEEEVFEIEEIVIVTTTTTTTTTTIPIKEDFPDELEQSETDTLDSEEGDQEVQPTELTDEEVEVLVEEVEEKITEVIEVEELEEVFESQDIEIIEEDELETLSEEEVEAYEEAVEEAVAEVVKELPTEAKVEVVKEVAKVSVQNLATADTQTKAVVKAVVKEVTKVETVAELNEEEKEAVGEVLGFKENAAEDVEIIAEQAAKDENISTAVDEYVERAIANEDVENFTLADVVTEVQVEAFLENPIGELVSVNIEISDVSLESIGSGMTTDQKEKAQEVVVPVIIASQIVAQAGALIRRF